MYSSTSEGWSALGTKTRKAKGKRGKKAKPMLWAAVRAGCTKDIVGILRREYDEASLFLRHTGESRYPGISQAWSDWTPAFARVTEEGERRLFLAPSRPKARGSDGQA